MLDVMDWREHIDIGSEPRLKRLGVSVEAVLTALGTGSSIDAVLTKVPGLTQVDVTACIAFAAETIQRTRFIESIQRGLADTAAGRLTDDDEFWDQLERESNDK